MEEKKTQERKDEEEQASLWWLFLPIFLGAAGGWYAWQQHKNREREFARIMLILGIVFTVIIVLFYIWYVLGIRIQVVRI